MNNLERLCKDLIAKGHGERLLLWETETNAAGQFDISMPVIRDGL